MSHTPRSTRRSFLKHVGFAGAALPLVMSPLVRAASPNGIVRHAGIGVDGMGFNDLHNIADHKHSRIVALCDVDKTRFKRADEEWPDARHFTDYRRMLEEFGDEIDSVTIATPDHTHAAITLTAMEHGKHVYTEKPLTHDIWEARHLALAAESRPDLVTQMGNQGNSRSTAPMILKLVQDGAIGKVREVHSVAPAGVDHDPRPDRADAVPDTLDWDAWIGPAPERPYVEELYHPYNWRYWLDFGTGQVGNFGVHVLARVKSPLQLGPPLTAISEGNPPTDEHWPSGAQVRYRFGPTPYTASEGLTLVWYDSGHRPPEDLIDLPEGRSLPRRGSFFIGEEGAMILDGSSAPQFFPEELHRSIERPEIAAMANHWHSFIDAIRGEGTVTSPFSYAGPLTEMCLVGCVAHRCHGEELTWDAESMTFPGSSRATELVKRDYRPGWFPDSVAS